VTRRAAAGAAAVLLLGLVVASQSWAELPRRVRVLVTFAPRELAVRRLGGSGTAFDRKYFSFLENARRRIPPETVAVMLSTDRTEAERYLATYYLAPLPVFAGTPADHWVLPQGWLIVAYGLHPTSDIGVFARLPEGVLLGPPQR
jgi:hypothetical protein